jgi:hypothetical protein
LPYPSENSLSFLSTKEGIIFAPRPALQVVGGDNGITSPWSKLLAVVNLSYLFESSLLGFSWCCFSLCCLSSWFLFLLPDSFLLSDFFCIPPPPSQPSLLSLRVRYLFYSLYPDSQLFLQQRITLRNRTTTKYYNPSSLSCAISTFTPTSINKSAAMIKRADLGRMYSGSQGHSGCAQDISNSLHVMIPSEMYSPQQTPDSRTILSSNASLDILGLATMM